jgi:two-component system response regulator MprA
MAKAGRILIVEDDADFRGALAEALADAGVSAEIALDGADALARLRVGPRPTAVLLDLRLPRLGGAELLRELRADPTFDRLPVVTMSAGEERLGPNGASAHVLHEPLDVGDLLQILISLSEAEAADGAAHSG